MQSVSGPFRLMMAVAFFHRRLPNCTVKVGKWDSSNGHGEGECCGPGLRDILPALHTFRDLPSQRGAPPVFLGVMLGCSLAMALRTPLMR